MTYAHVSGEVARATPSSAEVCDLINQAADAVESNSDYTPVPSEQVMRDLVAPMLFVQAMQHASTIYDATEMAEEMAGAFAFQGDGTITLSDQAAYIRASLGERFGTEALPYLDALLAAADPRSTTILRLAPGSAPSSAAGLAGTVWGFEYQSESGQTESAFVVTIRAGPLWKRFGHELYAHVMTAMQSPGERGDEQARHSPELDAFAELIDKVVQSRGGTVAEANDPSDKSVWAEGTTLNAVAGTVLGPLLGSEADVRSAEWADAYSHAVEGSANEQGTSPTN